MRFEDIEVGDKLRQKEPLQGDEYMICTVVAHGLAWAVTYDDQPTRPVYAYERSDAEWFEPIPVKREYHGVWPSDPGYQPKPDPLTEHPAVLNHGKGVSSKDLASFTESLASLSSSRIMGTGTEQYGQGDQQLFEHMTADELVEGLLEEAADAINYISMATIKFLAAAKAAT